VRHAKPHIKPVKTIDYRYEPRPWPFAIEQAEAIDRHWAKVCAQNSGLFNGRVLLAHHLEIADRDGEAILQGACSDVDYKAFLAWRDFGFPDQQMMNCFAMGALTTRDGAFMLGRMNETTANPGKLYFPAGTPDLSDVKGTEVDLFGSIVRELEEETGIRPSEVLSEPGWSIVFEGPRVACMKRVTSQLDVEQMQARFEAFIKDQTAPELVALQPVSTLADLDEERMPDFMLRYLRHNLDAGS
jgi:8-oxo-dGTP pyrophosphatase MutT (NUDIX family)